MEPCPSDHKSLVMALSQACEWLKTLQQRQVEGLQEAQGSLEAARAAMLQEEERLRAETQAERARLQQQLATIQQANEQAAQTGMAELQALQQKLSSLAAPEGILPTGGAQEAAALLTHSRSLALHLTWAHFVPHQGASALGELQLKDQCLSLILASAQPGRGDCAKPRSSHGKGTQQNGMGSTRMPHGICLSRPFLPGGEEALALQSSREEEAKPSPGETELGAEETKEGDLPPKWRPAVSPRAGEKSERYRLVAEKTDVIVSAIGSSTAPPSTGLLAAFKLPAPIPITSGTTGPVEPNTLFHARPVLVQEDHPDSSGETGTSGKVAVLPRARQSFPRWASAESLGRLQRVGPGFGPSLGGSCMELGPRQVKEGPQPTLVTSRCSPLLEGICLGEAPLAILPTQKDSPLSTERIARTQRWPAAPHTQAVPRCVGTLSPPCNQLVGQWGQRGSRQGQLCLPHGLHAAPVGSLYVVDFGNRRLQELGGAKWVLPLRGKAYFDVTLGHDGCLALTNSTGRCVELYNTQGVLLQSLSEGFRSPRGIALSAQGEFLVADTHLGVLHVLVTKGSSLVRSNTVLGFHKPYLVATNSHGEVGVSERGLDGGCCVKVLSSTWQVLRVLGDRSRPPLLTNPWGVSLDEAGRVLVADWGRLSHRVFCYPRKGQGWAVVTQGLSSPRGVALLGERHLVVADSMHHCLKAFRYC